MVMDDKPMEPHFDLTIDENELNVGATEIVKKLRPNWPHNQLQFKLFTNGITNKLIGVWYPGHYNEMVLVRVYGNKTELLIDRKAEIRNIRIMYKAGYTHALYATFNNGLAYQFVEGEVLTVETVRQSKVYQLVAKRMAQMHLLNPGDSEIERYPMIWSKTEKFMHIMPKEFPEPEKQARFQKLIKPYEELKQEYLLLKEKLQALDNPVVYAHNDLLLGNILYNQTENTVTFIDYEYAAYNYKAYDIANHFIEFAGIENSDFSLYPEETLQRAWIRIYIQTYNKSSNVSEDDVTKLYISVNKFALLSHFFWGCWSLIQSEHSNIEFDFLEYAAMRFNEYFKWKHKYLNM